APRRRRRVRADGRPPRPPQALRTGTGRRGTDHGIDARRSPLRAARRGYRSRPARSVPTRRTPRPRSGYWIPTRVAGHLSLETAFGRLEAMEDIPGARVRVLRAFSTDHSPRS